jgi:hypothetical protein
MDNGLNPARPNTEPLANSAMDRYFRGQEQECPPDDITKTAESAAFRQETGSFGQIPQPSSAIGLVPQEACLDLSQAATFACRRMETCEQLGPGRFPVFRGPENGCDTDIAADRPDTCQSDIATCRFRPRIGRERHRFLVRHAASPGHTVSAQFQFGESRNKASRASGVLRLDDRKRSKNDMNTGRSPK